MNEKRHANEKPRTLNNEENIDSLLNREQILLFLDKKFEKHKDLIDLFLKRTHESLKNFGEKFKNWLINFSEHRSGEMKDLVSDGLKKGWYLNELFIWAIYQNHDAYFNDCDGFIEDQILSQWDALWELIFKANSSRQRVLYESKIVFEQEHYFSAIHLYFSQANGIFSDHFEGSELFGNRGKDAKNKFDDHLDVCVDKKSFGLLISLFADGTLFRRVYNEAYKEGFQNLETDLTKKTKEISNEDTLSIPNRHGVMHGTHKNYGTRRNALKCLSLLMFVVFSIYGDKVYDFVERSGSTHE